MSELRDLRVTRTEARRIDDRENKRYGLWVTLYVTEVRKDGKHFLPGDYSDVAKKVSAKGWKCSRIGTGVEYLILFFRATKPSEILLPKKFDAEVWPVIVEATLEVAKILVEKRDAWEAKETLAANATKLARAMASEVTREAKKLTDYDARFKKLTDEVNEKINGINVYAEFEPQLESTGFSKEEFELAITFIHLFTEFKPGKILGEGPVISVGDLE